MSTHQDIGLDKLADKPGQSCWKATWDQATNTYAIQIDPSWWGATGNTVVVVDGVAMTRREADILLFTKRLHAIAARKYPHPVRFE